MITRKNAAALNLATAAMLGLGLAAASFVATAAPLILDAQGSFFVGGEIVHSEAAYGEIQAPAGGPSGRSGDIAVNQMYVRYMQPRGRKRVPLVLIHGGTLSGAAYETTPDGRMGWDEYFVRRGHTVYVPDQVSRARSGFNPTLINQVKLGAKPASAAPNLLLLPAQLAWQVFRFGPEHGTPHPGLLFPVEALPELLKQSVPDQNVEFQGGPSVPNPTWAALAALTTRSGGAVLLGHSESGTFPQEAALIDPAGVRGVVSIEPVVCPHTGMPQQLKVLARVPTLVVFGDYITKSAMWQAALESCHRYVQAINAAAGDATMMHLPAMGIAGNSHMVMQDRNSLQIAELIDRWIRQHVERRASR
jgi:pimeloyl-ACP methyl ester carboxylesterase